MRKSGWGKDRCMKCWPSGCRCPMSKFQQIVGLQTALSDLKNVLNDEEKRKIEQDLKKLQSA